MLHTFEKNESFSFQSNNSSVSYGSQEIKVFLNLEVSLHQDDPNAMNKKSLLLDEKCGEHKIYSPKKNYPTQAIQKQKYSNQIASSQNKARGGSNIVQKFKESVTIDLSGSPNQKKTSKNSSAVQKTVSLATTPKQNKRSTSSTNKTKSISSLKDINIFESFRKDFGNIRSFALPRSRSTSPFLKVSISTASLAPTIHPSNATKNVIPIQEVTDIE